MHNLFKELKKEHEQVRRILRDLSKTSPEEPAQRLDFVKMIKDELIPHSRAEEIIFYDCLRNEDRPTEVLGLEGYVEHNLIDRLLGSLETLDPETADWDAEFVVFKENLHQHLEHEEEVVFKRAESVLGAAELDLMAQEFLILRETFIDTLPSQIEAMDAIPMRENAIPPPQFLNPRE